MVDDVRWVDGKGEEICQETSSKMKEEDRGSSGKYDYHAP